MIPICKSVEEMNCIYTLNEVSGRIWELIGDKRKVREIRDELLKQYAVGTKKLEKDVIQTVKELEKMKCIIELPDA